MPAGKHSIRAAAAQLPAVSLGQADRAWALIENAVRQAQGEGAELLVLPECAYPAYLLESAERYRADAHFSSAQFLERLQGLASQSKLHLVCGFVEEGDQALHNSAALIAGDGRLAGIYRKSFLWGDDQKYFTSGRRIEAFDTALGRIGIAICADLRHPEIVASLMDTGAEYVAVPTCWVTRAQRSPDGWPSPQPEVLVPARAKEFGVPLICANKFGSEGDHVAYCGLSRIVDSAGRVKAHVGEHEAALICAVVDRAAPWRHDTPTWAAARILTPEPAIVPTAAEQETVKVVLVPEALIDRKKGRIADEAVLDAILDWEADVIIAHVPSESKADQFELQMRAMGLTAITSPSDYRVRYDWFGSYGSVSGAGAASFAPLRALALDGAALLVVFDAPDDRLALRARALENRCFLAATSPRGTFCADPNGAVLGATESAEPRPLLVTLPLGEACDKHVYADTDIWQQRRPHVYAQSTHLGLDI